MTLLGKVFTGVIFVLSVLFFSIAVAVNSTHINQKQEADRYRGIADTATREKEQLQRLLESLKPSWPLSRWLAVRHGRAADPGQRAGQ